MWCDKGFLKNYYYYCPTLKTPDHSIRCRKMISSAKLKLLAGLGWIGVPLCIRRQLRNSQLPIQICSKHGGPALERRIASKCLLKPVGAFVNRSPQPQKKDLIGHFEAQKSQLLVLFVKVVTAWANNLKRTSSVFWYYYYGYVICLWVILWHCWWATLFTK